MVKSLRLGMPALLAGCCLALPAVAEEPASGWRFAVTPYLWAAGVTGDATLPRRTQDFAVDFDDLLSDLNFALMGSVEARNGRLSLILDGMTLTTEDGAATPRGVAFSGATARLTTTQLGLLALGRVWEGEGAGLDLGAGLRAWWLDTRVSLAPGLAAGRSTSASTELVDPILAVRAEFRLAPRWSALAYADVGGFDIGSRLTWQLLGAVSWQASERVSVQAGYRHLAVESDRGGLAVDLALGGPILGLTLRF